MVWLWARLPTSNSSRWMRKALRLAAGTLGSAPKASALAAGTPLAARNGLNLWSAAIRKPFEPRMSSVEGDSSCSDVRQE